MKLVKNRFFLAAISILMAGVFIFAGIKLVEAQNETITVVKVASMIRRGELIDADKVSTITIGSYNISDDYLKATDDVVGRYALADFYPNDFIQKAKVAENLPSADERLLQLDGSRVAVSISMKELARSLSDKITAGDIISCLITTEDGTQIPPELTYLEVVTTTMPSGTDKANGGDNPENLATATLLATPYQATLLAEYDKTAEIHLALVYRGEVKTAQEFIQKQESAIKMLLASKESGSVGDVADALAPPEINKESEGNKNG